MKNLITLIVVVVSFLNLSAHTCNPEKVKCPIDGHKVEFCVTMSMTTFGSYLDFQKKGAIGNYYTELINCCNKCNFSGYIDDFKRKYSSSEKETIKNTLLKYKNLKLNEAQQCNVAAEIKIALSEKNDDIANCFLLGSYLIKFDKPSNTFRITLQEKTIEYLNKAVENNEYVEDESLTATIYYLIGELYRRIEKFDDSIMYFNLSNSKEKKENWLEDILEKQKKMSVDKDSNNEI